MQPLINEVEHAKSVFYRDLKIVESLGGFTQDMYVRYLSFQYHLTNGVQRHFLTIASHPSLSGRRSFRDFLYRFGLEEEPTMESPSETWRTWGRN